MRFLVTALDNHLLTTVLCGWWIRKPLAAIAMHGATAAVVGVMLATG